MHGSHTLLNLDLARLHHDELIRAIDRHHAAQSGRERRSARTQLRATMSALLITVGQRLRPEPRPTHGVDARGDQLVMRLAR